MLRVADFDLGSGTVRVHGKGATVIVIPLASTTLGSDLEIHLVGRGGDEFLLYGKSDALRPMSREGQNRWFKRCLERAELSTSMQMHELRHSAADNLYRRTGDIGKAQQLLRHESPATTAGYLHPSREDLRDAGFAPSNLT